MVALTPIFNLSKMLGKPITIICPPGSEDEFITVMQKIMQGESYDHFETLRRLKDGTIITVSVSSSPIKKEDAVP